MFSLFSFFSFFVGHSAAPSADGILAGATVLGPLAVPASTSASPLPSSPVEARLPQTEVAIEEEEEEFKSCRH